MDIFTPAKRSAVMAKIRGKNTRPEIVLRKALYANGIRYRLYGKLPGKPDIVLRKYKTVIFVNGCFLARAHRLQVGAFAQEQRVVLGE